MTTKPFDELCTWWQFERQGTIKDLAAELQVTPATVYYWLREKPDNVRKKDNLVPLKYLKRIAKLTNNEFPPERMRPDIFGKPTE